MNLRMCEGCELKGLSNCYVEELCKIIEVPSARATAVFKMQLEGLTIDWGTTVKV